MPFSVHPVTVSDAEALAPVMMGAWYENQQWVELWHEPSLSNITVACSRRLPWNLLNGRHEKRHEKAIDVETGRVIGYARWVLPPVLVERTAWLEAQVPDVNLEQRQLFEQDFRTLTDEKGNMRGIKHELAVYRSRPLEAASAEIMESGSFLANKLTLCLTAKVLDYLTVAPAYQRQGIASMLLASGLKIADANGLKTTLMSSPAALKVYQRQGFELVRTVSTAYPQFGGTLPVVNYFLVRQPVPEGSVKPAIESSNP
ncbi:MAG: hypothetical protein Q9195_005733 [Heterodermia aff. obscurata]